ncbi:MAG: hypothetical protein K6G24_07100 [Lachnospiraceae bacterium]|nr:hypothetical protein [Lachnospiraceae bacterium]
MAKETISQTEGLCKEVTNCIRNAYDRGYKQGFKDGNYNKEFFCNLNFEHGTYKGLDDAWECARKIVQREANGEENIVDERLDGYDTFMTYTAAECITRIKEYEEKQKQADSEVKVGDEVVDDCGIKSVVVTDEITSDGCVSLLTNYYQTTQLYPIKKLRKTGRHFDQIAEVLEQLKEAQDETK